MTKRAVIIGLFLGFVVVLFAISCGNSNPRPTGAGQAFYVASGKGFNDSDSAIHKTLDDSVGVPRDRSTFTTTGTTPMGARYYSTVPVPQEFLAAIDEGISHQIARYNAVFPTWGNYGRVEDYDVLIITANCQNVETSPGSPAMCFSGVQTAGTNIGNSGVPAVKKPYIVIPQEDFVMLDLPTGRERREVTPKWGHLEYWRNSAEYESEHIRESVNDRGYFEKFAINGDVHPHEIP